MNTIKELVSVLGACGVLLATLLACKNNPAHKAVGESCTTDSDCEGSLLCKFSVCKDVWGEKAENTEPEQHQHTYRGLSEHQIYGMTRHTKMTVVLDNNGQVATAPNPFNSNQICTVAKRQETGTLYLFCLDTDSGCEIYSPMSNYDPNADNIGWMCGFDITSTSL